jgi:hypothetical protein
MAAHHLLGEPPEHVGDGELILLGGDLGVEEDLEQQVPELLLDVEPVATLQGLHHFVGLFDQVPLQGGSGLLVVPGTAPRPAESSHDFNETFEEEPGGVGHVRT